MADQFPLRATGRAAQDACRDEGLCGEVAPDEKSICIKYEDHGGPHGWESAGND